MCVCEWPAVAAVPEPRSSSAVAATNPVSHTDTQTHAQTQTHTRARTHTAGEKWRGNMSATQPLSIQRLMRAFYKKKVFLTGFQSVNPSSNNNSIQFH